MVVLEGTATHAPPDAEWQERLYHTADQQLADQRALGSIHGDTLLRLGQPRAGTHAGLAPADLTARARSVPIQLAHDERTHDDCNAAQATTQDV